MLISSLLSLNSWCDTHTSGLQQVFDDLKIHISETCSAFYCYSNINHMMLQADFNMYFVSLTMVFISNNKAQSNGDVNKIN